MVLGGKKNLPRAMLHELRLARANQKLARTLRRVGERNDWVPKSPTDIYFFQFTKTILEKTLITFMKY